MGSYGIISKPRRIRSPGITDTSHIPSGRILYWICFCIISKFDPLMFQFYNLANEPMAPVSLPENMIYSIHQDGNGHYYAGGQNKGLMSWNPENDKVEHYLVSEVEGAPENKIFDIEESEN